MSERFIDFYNDNTNRSHLPGLPLEIPVQPVRVKETGNRNSERGGSFYQQMFLLPTGSGFVLDGLGKYRPFEPPNKMQRLQNVTSYLSNKLKTAEDAFETLKGAILLHHDENGPIVFNWNKAEDAEFGTHPVDEYDDARGTAALMRLQSAARTYRKLLKIVEAEYAELPEIIAEREAFKKKKQQRETLNQKSKAYEKRKLKSVEKINL